MRKNGEAAVWVMDSDWWDEPRPISDSLTQFIAALADGIIPE